MAADAQAEGPALVPTAPPLSSSASLEKRPGDDGGAEEEDERRLHEPKRRRACVAALDSVPSAAASPVAEEAEDAAGSGCGGGGDGDGDGDGDSFSFHHARRGGFAALETTPKFGSFNPPGEAELAALDLMPAGHEADAQGSPEEEVPGAEAEDGSLQLVDGKVDGQVQA